MTEGRTSRAAGQRSTTGRAARRPRASTIAGTALAAATIAANPAHAASPPRINRTIAPGIRPAPKFVPSSAFLDSWMEVDPLYPLGLKVRTFVRSLTGEWQHVAWVRNGDSWILEVDHIDPLTRRMDHFAYRFGPPQQVATSPDDLELRSAVMLTGAAVDQVPYTGMALLKLATIVFKELQGKDAEAEARRPAGIEACHRRVDRARASTTDYVAKLREQGEDVPPWIIAGKDRSGNAYETCFSGEQP